MMDGKLPFIQNNIQDTHQWLHEISENMSQPDLQKSYHALRGVLFAIRDRLPPEEVFDFSSQLPMMIQGLFFESYKPKDKPYKYKRKEEFLAYVEKELQQVGGEEPEKAALAVFQVLNNHISQGEMDDVLSNLPEHIRDFLLTPV